MMYGKDDLVDVGENDSGSVGGLLDGAEDDQVDVGENDNGGVGGCMVQKMTQLMQARMTMTVQVDYWMVQR